MRRNPLGFDFGKLAAAKIRAQLGNYNRTPGNAPKQNGIEEEKGPGPAPVSFCMERVGVGLWWVVGLVHSMDGAMFSDKCVWMSSCPKREVDSSLVG